MPSFKLDTTLMLRNCYTGWQAHHFEQCRRLRMLTAVISTNSCVSIAVCWHPSPTTALITFAQNQRGDIFWHSDENAS